MCGVIDDGHSVIDQERHGLGLGHCDIYMLLFSLGPLDTWNIFILQNIVGEGDICIFKCGTLLYFKVLIPVDYMEIFQSTLKKKIHFLSVNTEKEKAHQHVFLK